MRQNFGYMVLDKVLGIVSNYELTSVTVLKYVSSPYKTVLKF